MTHFTRIFSAALISLVIGAGAVGTVVAFAFPSIHSVGNADGL